MGGKHQVGARGAAGANADDVAGMVDADVLQAGALEEAFELAAADLFVERRGGNLAHPYLFLEHARLVALDGGKGRADGRVVYQAGGILSPRGGGASRRKEQGSEAVHKRFIG